MGLALAIKAHKEGNLKFAEKHYERAYKQGVQNPTLFLNYGALLRNLGKASESQKIYEEGLAKFPSQASILNNYCNLIRENQPAKALNGYIQVLHYRIHQDPSDTSLISQAYSNVAEVLKRLNLHHLSKTYILFAIQQVGASPELLRNLLLLQDSSVLNGLIEDGNDGSNSSIIVESLLACINDCPPVKQAALFFVVACHHLATDNPSDALQYYRKAQAILSSLRNLSLDDQSEAQQLVDVNSWNFACVLLKLQYLTEGWKLFEYGLRTPAPGAQKWQRALKKPFTADQIKLWRGESLEGKHLLVMEEQGIGDGMMFLTLIPKLLEEAKKITLLLCARLYPIYKQSFDDYISKSKISVLTHRDIHENRVSLSVESFDYQVPIGSICQHRFTEIKNYGRFSPILKPDPINSKALQQSYLNASGASTNSKKLIGISWRGGGRPDRIKQKSLELEQFTQILLDNDEFCFVILQYGSVKTEYDYWRDKNIDVVHDESIDPVKNMYAWLDQVAACEAVISVANTTIHGAGGLGVSTLCLLGNNSDWRWFSDPSINRSYWYPSVGVTRQDETGSWNTAIREARAWLSNGFPLPQGPVSTCVV